MLILVDEPGSRKHPSLPPRYERATTRGEDVLHPVGLRSVCKSDHVVASTPEREYRRLIKPMRSPSRVLNEPETSQTAGQRRRQPIRYTPVEAC